MTCRILGHSLLHSLIRLHCYPFSCSALLALLTRSTALILSFAHALAMAALNQMRRFHSVSTHCAAVVFRMCVWLCICVLFHCRSSSWHGYLGNFGGTFVYVYLYDCVIVSFLLFLVIGITRPLFRNFSRSFVHVYARVHVFVCSCARRHVGMCVFCNRSSSRFRNRIDITRARVRVHASARRCMCVYEKGSRMFYHSF